MLTEVLRYIRNYFPLPDKAVEGSFTIEEGTVGLSNVVDGQYFLIEGSALNDGVYLYPVKDLKDEQFTGRITPLAIPKEVVAIAEEVAEFCDKFKETPYISESFGGYTYNRGTNGKGGIMSWQNAFGARLSAWRKV